MAQEILPPWVGYENMTEEERNAYFEEKSKVTRARHDALLSKARRKEDLLLVVYGSIYTVIGTTKALHHTPASEAVFGGSSPSYYTGQGRHLEVMLAPNLPVKKLTFPDWIPLQKGDSIRAHVFKGTEIAFNRIVCASPELIDRSRRAQLIYRENPWPPGPGASESFFIEEEWKEEERALKIEKLVMGTVVASYLDECINQYIS